MQPHRSSNDDTNRFRSVAFNRLDRLAANISQVKEASVIVGNPALGMFLGLTQCSVNTLLNESICAPVFTFWVLRYIMSCVSPPLVMPLLLQVSIAFPSLCLGNNGNNHHDKTDYSSLTFGTSRPCICCSSGSRQRAPRNFLHLPRLGKRHSRTPSFLCRWLVHSIILKKRGLTLLGAAVFTDYETASLLPSFIPVTCKTPSFLIPMLDN